MRLSLVLALALVPAVASADKTFSDGRGGSWDCAKDPVVKIAIPKGGGTFTVTGACKSAEITGGDVILHIAAVESLTITGGGNAVDVGEVETISISGAGNKVMWKKAKGDKPTTNVIGNNNTVARG
jgi:hypothetical protein